MGAGSLRRRTRWIRRAVNRGTGLVTGGLVTAGLLVAASEVVKSLNDGNDTARLSGETNAEKFRRLQQEALRLEAELAELQSKLPDHNIVELQETDYQID